MSYVDDKLAEIVSKIEEQDRLFNLMSVNADLTCPTYLSMSEDDISKLSSEELAIAEIKLNSFAMCIQKNSNTSNAIKNWAERSLSLLVAKEYDTFDKYMKYEVRRDSVIISNEYAKKLYEIISKHSIIIDEMSFLSQNIHHVSSAFGRLAMIRRRERNDAS